MKPIKPCAMRRAREAMERHEPVSFSDLIDFDCRCAKERAPAEQVRLDEPQSELSGRA